MSGPDWYRWYPGKWLAGTLGLTNEQRGVYIQIINVILDRGECPEDEDYLMALCNCHRRVLRRVLGELIRAGKITKVGGNFEQTRAKLERKEAETFVEEQRNRAVKGWKTKRLAYANNGNANHNHNHNKDSESDEETESPVAPNGAAEGASRLDLDAELYRHGKRLLGAKAGGVITELKRIKSVSGALEVIQAAQSKADPMEYVQAAIRNAKRSGSSWGLYA